MKEVIKRLPVVGDVARQLYWKATAERAAVQPFSGSTAYWRERYSTGGNSGAGSYGKFAAFKAAVLNDFVASNGVVSVIEFGCGDGNQLRLADYPRYLGLDVSETAVAACRELFAGDTCKQFRLLSEYDGETADLTLSLDVIYHLVEDQVFHDHMRQLFAASDRYVIVYASNRRRGNTAAHVRHRKFTAWIRRNEPGWKLERRIPNKFPYRGDHTKGSFADFYIYGRA